MATYDLELRGVFTLRHDPDTRSIIIHQSGGGVTEPSEVTIRIDDIKILIDWLERVMQFPEE